MSNNEPVFSIKPSDIESMILQYVYEHQSESEKEKNILTTDLVKGLSGFLHQRIEQSLNLPFNGLSPAELERLAILTEEMGETHQAIGKILRHGYESRYPDDGPSNRETLERELGDVEFAGTLLKRNGDLDDNTVEKYRLVKSYKIGKYLHHHHDFVEIK